MNTKLSLYVFLGSLYNRLFHNSLNMLIYLTALGWAISLAVQPSSRDLWGMFSNVFVVAVILALTTKRLSNNSIYSRVTKTLSMNIQDFSVYHSLDYINDRTTIAQIYQEEFIEAIETAHKRGYKKIKMTTHFWVYSRIVLHERVAQLYHVKVKEKGHTKIPLEVTLLVNKATIDQYPDKIMSEAIRDRIKYQVTLTRR